MLSHLANFIMNFLVLWFLAHRCQWECPFIPVDLGSSLGGLNVLTSMPSCIFYYNKVQMICRSNLSSILENEIFCNSGISELIILATTVDNHSECLQWRPVTRRYLCGNWASPRGHRRMDRVSGRTTGSEIRTSSTRCETLLISQSTGIVRL